MTTSSEESLPRIDELLMRVLDGEATAGQRAELMALVDADARLAALSELRERLREAVLSEVGEPDEVVGEVMAALALDDGWEATASALREALIPASIPDVSEAVLAAIAAPPEAQLSALYDGELSVEDRLANAQRLMKDREAHQTLAHYAELGRMVREATQHAAGPRFEGVWREVAQSIGLDDPEEVPGWEPIGEAVREAVLVKTRLSAEESALLTGAILNALPRPEAAAAPVAAPPLPWWRALLRAPMLIAAVGAALVLLTVNAPDRGAQTPESPVQVADNLPVTPQDGEIAIGEFNQAEVESLEVAEDVMVQVVQLEDGAPVLLMIDEDAMVEGATL